MNPAHTHLILNHLPVLGIPFAFLLLLAAALTGSRDLTRAGLWACILAAVLTVPVYLSGEPAEHLVQGLECVSGPAIEEHEDSAGWALGGGGALGLAAAAALFVSRGGGRAPRWLLLATLVVAAADASILVRTAYLGGQVHHQELRG